MTSLPDDPSVQDAGAAILAEGRQTEMVFGPVNEIPDEAFSGLLDLTSMPLSELFANEPDTVLAAAVARVLENPSDPRQGTFCAFSSAL
jgi:FXSXX-COOH protein